MSLNQMCISHLMNVSYTVVYHVYQIYTVIRILAKCCNTFCLASWLAFVGQANNLPCIDSIALTLILKAMSSTGVSGFGNQMRAQSCTQMYTRTYSQ